MDVGDYWAIIMLGVFGIITIITRTFGINATINNDQQTFTRGTKRNKNPKVILYYFEK